MLIWRYGEQGKTIARKNICLVGFRYDAIDAVNGRLHARRVAMRPSTPKASTAGRVTRSVPRRSCKSRALTSGEFPSVVFVDSPCDRGSTAMTRVTLERVFNCSDHRYAGSRQPGIGTNARSDVDGLAWR